VTASALTDPNRLGAAGIDGDRASHTPRVCHRHQPAHHIPSGSDGQLQRQRHPASAVGRSKRRAGAVERGLLAVQDRGGHAMARPRLVKLPQLQCMQRNTR
jgi:hypothetical protein